MVIQKNKEEFRLKCKCFRTPWHLLPIIIFFIVIMVYTINKWDRRYYQDGLTFRLSYVFKQISKRTIAIAIVTFIPLFISVLNFIDTKGKKEENCSCVSSKDKKKLISNFHKMMLNMQPISINEKSYQPTEDGFQP